MQQQSRINKLYLQPNTNLFVAMDNSFLYLNGTTGALVNAYSVGITNILGVGIQQDAIDNIVFIVAKDSGNYVILAHDMVSDPGNVKYYPRNTVYFYFAFRIQKFHTNPSRNAIFIDKTSIEYYSVSGVDLIGVREYDLGASFIAKDPHIETIETNTFIILINGFSSNEIWIFELNNAGTITKSKIVTLTLEAIFSMMYYEDGGFLILNGKNSTHTIQLNIYPVTYSIGLFTQQYNYKNVLYYFGKNFHLVLYSSSNYLYTRIVKEKVDSYPKNLE